MVVSLQERLDAWRQAESAAREAESALARAGQAAADPAWRTLALEAARLRETADRLFAAACRAVPTEEPPSSAEP